MAQAEMASQADGTEAPRKKGKRPLVLGLLAAILLGGAGFYATWTGMILGSDPSREAGSAAVSPLALPGTTFVPVDPLTISLGPSANSRHLRFRTELEVPDAYASDVERILPRVVDVLNSYLRALTLKDLEDPAALIRLRAQMLRRVQIVTGAERVNDLLVMEFVLN